VPFKRLSHTESIDILTGANRKRSATDLGYRGRTLDAIRLIHRGRYKSLNPAERRLLKQRQAIEPNIGHLNDEPRMWRNHPKGEPGDAINSRPCEFGFCPWLPAARPEVHVISAVSGPSNT
jgi:hypothetical protein